jgi:hypothetical protein
MVASLSSERYRQGAEHNAGALDFQKSFSI